MTATTIIELPENERWTIAYRKRTGPVFHRVTNWSGTWAEAREMAQAFGAIHPDLQVWYTTSAAYERVAALEVAAGTLSASHGEDIGNILVDSGKRVKVRDNGTLDAELLDADIVKVAAELHDGAYEHKRHITVMRESARGKWYARLDLCLARAQAMRDDNPKAFASAVRQARTAEERWNVRAM